MWPKWLLRCACYILSSSRGHKPYWTWLANMGFDPALPRRIVLSQSSHVYTTGGLPDAIPTPSLPPDAVSTISGWRLTWFLVTMPGWEKFGDPGEASGRPRMTCILEPTDR